jgi:hypothetical protein
MTTENNKNYTDAERVLDFLLNSANYSAYYFCYDGNHSWDEEAPTSNEDIAKIINGHRNKSKFLWWNNRTMDFCFYDCVDNDGIWKGSICPEDWAYKIEDVEAFDFLKCSRDYFHSGRQLNIKLDDEAYEDFFREQLGWDEDRFDAAQEAAIKLYFTK